jgi:hypothetical protein
MPPLPYILRLIVLRRLIWPSTCPLLHGSTIRIPDRVPIPLKCLGKSLERIDLRLCRCGDPLAQVAQMAVPEHCLKADGAVLQWKIAPRAQSDYCSELARMAAFPEPSWGTCLGALARATG